MKKANKNRFQFNQSYGLFVGELADNQFHKHYAQQISVSITQPLVLKIGEKKQEGHSFFINANISHQLISEGIQLTVLINPLSALGHQLHDQFTNESYVFLEDGLPIELKLILGLYESGKLSFEDLCDQVSDVLNAAVKPIVM